MGLRFSPECINCVSTFWGTVQAEILPDAHKTPGEWEKTGRLDRQLRKFSPILMIPLLLAGEKHAAEAVREPKFSQMPTKPQANGRKQGV